MTEQSYERTKYEAVLDVSYGICWNSLNERLFGRIDWVFGAITLFGGSTIIFTVTADHKLAAAWVSGVVAISAILERSIGATEKRLEHKAMKRRLCELQAKCSSLSLEEIDRDLSLLRADEPTGLRGLDMVAYNQNVRAHGRGSYIERLSLWEWLLSILA